MGDGSEASVYRDEDRVEWRLGSPALGSRLGSLFTRYPADSWRLKNGGPERAFAEALDREAWDAILIDHAALGWALDPIRNRRRAGTLSGDPVVVYISHNHEAKVRREVARNSSANLPRRLALRLDAEKYARQEEALCREADLVTAITPAEVEAYREQFPGQQYLCLTPGYEGPFFPERRITAETPAASSCRDPSSGSRSGSISSDSSSRPPPLSPTPASRSRSSARPTRPSAGNDDPFSRSRFRRPRPRDEPLPPRRAHGTDRRGIRRRIQTEDP